MSKAFTAGDVETPEVVRPLPVGRRPLTFGGMQSGQADMRRWLRERSELEARSKTGADVQRLLQANARTLAWHERRLSLSDVAPRPTPPIERAALGVRVSVTDEESGDTLHYTLVGPDEVDAALGRVSHLSPIGQALLSRRVGERTFFKRPKGTLEVVIDSLEEDGSLLMTAEEPNQTQ